MDPEKVQKLDAVDQIENLLKIGLSAGEKIKLEHFGPFAQQFVRWRGCTSPSKKPVLDTMDSDSDPNYLA